MSRHWRCPKCGEVFSQEKVMDTMRYTTTPFPLGKITVLTHGPCGAAMEPFDQDQVRDYLGQLDRVDGRFEDYVKRLEDGE